MGLAALVLAMAMAGCGSAPPVARQPSKPRPARSVVSRADGSAGPQSISFISATEGWALGPGSCSGCARIWHTTDAGTHWRSMTTTVHLPGADRAAVLEGLVQLRFAGAKEGYLFVASRCSASCALVTRDGGVSWHPVDLPEVG